MNVDQRTSTSDSSHSLHPFRPNSTWEETPEQNTLVPAVLPGPAGTTGVVKSTDEAITSNSFNTLSRQTTSNNEAIAETFKKAYANHGLRGVDELRATLGRAIGELPPATVNTTWEFITASQLKTLPGVSYMLEGMIQDRGINVIYGPPKAGKSFVVLRMATEVAQRDERVLYCAGEGFPGYAARVEALERLTKWSVANLAFSRAVNLFDDAITTEFIEAAKSEKFRLVIFDTLASSMIGGVENNTSDMQRVIANSQRIIDAVGCAVLLVHHTTKTGGQYRGSSALLGGADMMIEFANDDELITVTCNCSKNSEGFESRCFRLVQSGHSVAALPSDRVIMRGAKLTPTQRKILEILNLDTFAKVGAKGAVLERVAEIPESTMYRALSRLVREGFVTQSVKGDPYYIADKGKQEVGDFLSPL